MSTLRSASLFAWAFLFAVMVARSSEPAPLTITGRVTDEADGRPVQGAHLFLRETGRMAITDEGGAFTLAVPRSGRYTIAVRHVAYMMVERAVTLREAGETTVEIALASGQVQVEEVVVQSTRVSGTAGTTTFPVAIAAGADIQRPALSTVPEALAGLPGIALARDGSYETSLSVRGMGRAGVVAMVDGSRIETSTDLAGPLSLIAVHDLDRVEVIKGPASSLDGTGALGGSVHFSSKQPAITEHPRAGLHYVADAASVNGAFGQFLSLDGGNGPLAVRVSGGRRIARSTRTPAGVLDNSGFSDFSLAGAIACEFLPGHTLIANYQRVQAEDAGIPGGAPIAATARATYTLARRELMSAEYRAPNLAACLPLLTVRASRQEIDRNVEIVQSPAVTVTPHAIHVTDGAQAEARVLPSEDLLLTVGAELWQRALESWREKRQVVTGAITGERPLPVSAFLSGGVFAQGEWRLVPDRWTATFGARHDWIRVHNDEVWSPEYLISGGVRQSPAPGSKRLWAARTANDASWSANAGLAYAPVRGLEITALCASAFRSPSLEERYDFVDLGSYVRLGNPDLHAEQSLSLNAGIRCTDALVRLQGDAFLNMLTNMVAELPGTYEGRPAYIRANIGKARLYGYEMSVECRPVRALTLAATLAAVRGEDRGNHTDLPQIPPWNGTVSASTHVPDGGRIALVASWAARQGRPGGDETSTPGYVVLDADVTAVPLDVAGASVTLHAGIRNIFDRDYRLHLSTLRGVVRSEPGRNVVLSATVTL